ncbi:hypothetical protein Peur_050509 [Populus x canadensis]
MVVLLVTPPATQTLSILEPNRAATENTLCVFPKALILVLAIVFPNVQDSDKDMVFCTLLEDDLDGGLSVVDVVLSDYIDGWKMLGCYYMQLGFPKTSEADCWTLCLLHWVASVWLLNALLDVFWHLGAVFVSPLRLLGLKKLTAICGSPIAMYIVVGCF